MKTLLRRLLATPAGLLRTRVLQRLEILALRQRLTMIADKDRERLRFRRRERLAWVWPA